MKGEIQNLAWNLGKSLDMFFSLKKQTISHSPFCIFSCSQSYCCCAPCVSLSIKHIILLKASSNMYFI